jgi:hypothetical protein
VADRKGELPQAAPHAGAAPAVAGDAVAADHALAEQPLDQAQHRPADATLDGDDAERGHRHEPHAERCASIGGHRAAPEMQRKVGEADRELPFLGEHSPAGDLDEVHAEPDRPGEGLGLHHDLPVDLGEALAQQVGELGRELLGELVRQAGRREQPDDDRLLARGHLR